MNNKLILKKFSELIKIQSVSTDSKRNSEILNAVDFIENELVDLGFQVKMYKVNKCSPLIIAKKIVSSSAKTLGFYAHYDVQPEDPINKWQTPPFKLTINNGKIYGRGTADDKGHLIQILEGARKIIKENKLKNNLVFIFEGEEEIGSVNFEALIKKDQSLINTDIFYVVDMGMKKRNVPQIFYGLRGIITFELVIKTSETDLHSGVYGNRVFNSAQLAADLLAKMVNGETHKINIPDFYKDVKSVSNEEKELLMKSNDTLVSKINPSIDINGMVSGYTGEGSKTIIPASSLVKFSVRLVPNQDYRNIIKLTEKFVKDNLPKEVKYFLKSSAGSNAFYTDYKNSYTLKTAKIFEKVFGNKTLFNRSGGSVAAAEIIKRLFKKPVVLIGFSLPDDNLHAPNENFDEEMFFKGIEAIENIMLQ